MAAGLGDERMLNIQFWARDWRFQLGSSNVPYYFRVSCSISVGRKEKAQSSPQAGLRMHGQLVRYDSRLEAPTAWLMIPMLLENPRQGICVD